MYYRSFSFLSASDLGEERGPLLVVPNRGGAGDTPQTPRLRHWFCSALDQLLHWR